MTVSQMRFDCGNDLPIINELRAPSGFSIGENSFDERFTSVLRCKLDLDNNISLQEEQAVIMPFIKDFHQRHKTQLSDDKSDESYPCYVPDGNMKFSLTRKEMDHIMMPPIKEICQRINQYLAGIKIDCVVLSGGNSELAPLREALKMMLEANGILKRDGKIIHKPAYSSNAVVRGLHFWVNNPRLVRSRYPRMSLARVAKHELTELDNRFDVPAKDSQLQWFYDSANRIMTEGVCVPEGIQTVDIYFDIDANETTPDILPIDLCIPNTDAVTYDSGMRKWNFASHCTTVATVDLQPIVADIMIGNLKKAAGKRRRFWLHLGFEVGIEVIVEVFWCSDGLRCSAETSDHSKKCHVGIPDRPLLQEFRAPVQKRQSSDGTINNDTLGSYLDEVQRGNEMKKMENEKRKEEIEKKKRDSEILLRHNSSYMDQLYSNSTNFGDPSPLGYTTMIGSNGAKRWKSSTEDIFTVDPKKTYNCNH
uniref:Uncharacterized protein n=1 Tax=Clarireedia homoeocarpa TaxID=1436886 RepID=A0A0K0M9Z2_9HELO|nr:hypothetical protein [Clarireedia homoeocarpa]